MQGVQLQQLIALTRSPLSPEDRVRVMTQITADAHARDLVEFLIHHNITDVTSFQWQSQLKNRYANSEASIHIADAKFAYGLEYLGNCPRLVITPLTDRFYVTATQALHLSMGCAPAGPAGACSACLLWVSCTNLLCSVGCIECRHWQNGDDKGPCRSPWQVLLRVQLCPRA